MPTKEPPNPKQGEEDTKANGHVQNNDSELKVVSGNNNPSLSNPSNKNNNHNDNHNHNGGDIDLNGVKVFDPHRSMVQIPALAYSGQAPVLPTKTLPYTHPMNTNLNSSMESSAGTNPNVDHPRRVGIGETGTGTNSATTQMHATTNAAISSLIPVLQQQQHPQTLYSSHPLASYPYTHHPFVHGVTTFAASSQPNLQNVNPFGSAMSSSPSNYSNHLQQQRQQYPNAVYPNGSNVSNVANANNPHEATAIEHQSFHRFYHPHMQQPSPSSHLQHISSPSYISKMLKFPDLLYKMLMDADSQQFSHVMSWLPHGRAFMIWDSLKFEVVVMPKYFPSCKWKSFRRQLNLYDCVRIGRGKDRGGYHHSCLLRGRPDLLIGMKRVKLKGENAIGNKSNGKTDDNRDPDFYRMPPISPAPSLPPTEASALNTITASNMADDSCSRSDNNAEDNVGNNIGSSSV